MSDNKFWRRVATLLRKMPWIMVVAHVFIRLLQPRYTVGVVGVVFNAQGQVLLAEHVFHARLPWGLPGGWMNRDEEPAIAICREFKEELDLDVTIEKLLLAEKHESNHIDLAFLCHASGNVGKLSNELLDYRWFTPRDLPPIRKFHYRAIQQALGLLETQV